jgi:hypothetical protein
MFRVLGILLVLCLLGWIFAVSQFAIGVHPPPPVLGIGSSFEGNLQLPQTQITASFEAARNRMLEINGSGTKLRLAGDIAGWLSFAATSIITLIVGFFGRSPAGTNSAAETHGLPARSVRFIGLLAALAAVLTAFSNLSIAKSQDYFKRSDEVQALIVRSRAQVIDAKSATDAQAVLDNLLLQSNR